MEFETGYVCGMLAAKGHVNEKGFSISLETADQELAEIAKRFLSLFGEIKIRQRERNGLKTSIVMLKGDDVKALTSRGIKTGRREWNVPSEAFSSENFRLGFLRAFFDFSGTIKVRLRKKGQKERVMKIASINENGLRQVRALLDIEGVKAMLYKSGKSCVLEINGKNNLDIFLKKIGLEKRSKKELLEKALDPVEFENLVSHKLHTNSYLEMKSS